MTVTPARWAALDVLRSVRRGELADRALARAQERVSPRDRAWLQELVYGTLRLRGRLDHLLGQLVKRGLERLDPDVLDLLRLGAYQILEMQAVPVYAAVSQTVEAAKAVAGRGAGGLVNGVLHSLVRRLDELEVPDFDRDPVGYLVAWGSHPRWLVERWVRRFGEEGARALVEANNRRPELYVRPLGMGPDAAREILAGAGIAAEPVPFAPDALHILPPASAAQVLEVIPAVVQDPAASLVTRFVDPPENVRVADLCAAPGGKALGLAHGGRYVAAADLSWNRMARLRENAERVGTGNLGLLVADARRPPLRPVEVVLIDVPCTGTGTFRRHPDGRWRIGPEDLAALAALQAEILEAAAGIVAPGGILVYATCSLEPEENEDQVDAFLNRHPEFTLAPPPATLDPDVLDERGRLVVLPHRNGVDGAFAARMVRR